MKTNKVRSKTGYFFLALFAIFIGLYPLKFVFFPESNSLLDSKSPELLTSSIYMFTFYTHILIGGLALISGFSQFFPKLRTQRPSIHRNLGKTYVIAVMFSGTTGLCIAFFATGGIFSVTGFGMLAILWLFTTTKAYLAIRNKEIDKHQQWMIISYALCFAAVTLRLYLPLFTGVFHVKFMTAYPFIAWLCWMPNVLIAEFGIIRK